MGSNFLRNELPKRWSEGSTQGNKWLNVLLIVQQIIVLLSNGIVGYNGQLLQCYLLRGFLLVCDNNGNVSYCLNLILNLLTVIIKIGCVF